MHRWSFQIALVILTFSRMCAADIAVGEAKSTLPETWMAIPREILDERERRMKARMPDADVAHWDIGFEQSSEMAFAPPYVLARKFETDGKPNLVQRMFEVALGQQKEMASNIHKQSNGSITVDGFWLPIYNKKTDTMMTKMRSNGPNGSLINVAYYRGIGNSIYMFSGYVSDERPDTLSNLALIDEIVNNFK